MLTFWLVVRHDALGHVVPIQIQKKELRDRMQFSVSNQLDQETQECVIYLLA